MLREQLAGPLQLGRLYLARRGAEWYEVLVVAPAGGEEWLVYTTDVNAEQWQWTLLRYIRGEMVLMTSNREGRSPPAQIAKASVGWLCDPLDVSKKWVPRQQDLLRLTQEATQILAQVSVWPAPEELIVIPGLYCRSMVSLEPALARHRPASGGKGGSQGPPFELRHGHRAVDRIEELSKLVCDLRAEIAAERSIPLGDGDRARLGAEPAEFSPRLADLGGQSSTAGRSGPSEKEEMASKKDVSKALDDLVERLLAVQQEKRRGDEWETVTKVQPNPVAKKELGRTGLKNIL